MRDREFEQELVYLAYRFPSLAGAPHLASFDIEAFDSWVAGLELCPARYAGQFIIAVFDGTDVEFRAAGPFEVVPAFAVWDDEHRRAFLSWAEAPW
jgi:hypothetical protein